MPKYPSQESVLLRVDFNLPLKNNQVLDEQKLLIPKQTIDSLHNHGCQIILMTHFSAKNSKDRTSTRILISELERIYERSVHFLPDFSEKTIEDIKNSCHNFFLMENLRMHPGEEACDPSFAHTLSLFGDFYVNDAFSVCHRSHASIVLLPQLLPHAPGIHLKQETEILKNLFEIDEHPFVACIGGSKIDTKFSFLKALLEKVDLMLVGGALSHIFLKARGYNLQKSYCVDNDLENAKALLETYHHKIILPLDFVGPNLNNNNVITAPIFDLPDDFCAKDIGGNTRALFNEKISTAKRILWNGPMGVIEESPFEKGTLNIIKAISRVNGQSLCGGGETLYAIDLAKQKGMDVHFTYTSTAGGAFLQWVENQTLPGLDALT